MLAAASARASLAAATRGLDADDFRHPLDKQASLLFLSVYTVRLRDGCNFPSSEKFSGLLVPCHYVAEMLNICGIYI